MKYVKPLCRINCNYILDTVGQAYDMQENPRTFKLEPVLRGVSITRPAVTYVHLGQEHTADAVSRSSYR